MGSSVVESDNEVVTVHCHECGEYIPADNWIEHTDFHVAMRLQKSINQLSPASTLSSQHETVKGLSKNKVVPKKSKLTTLDKFLKKT